MWGTFVSLVGSQLGGAALGLVFWMAAARTLDPIEVGLGASLVAAMTLFAMFGAMGVGTLLLERLKVAPKGERRTLMSTGFGVAGAGAAILAAAWLILSMVVHLPGALGDISRATALLLVAASATAAICTTFDLAVLGLAAGSLQLRRNLVAGSLRIVVFLGLLAGGVRNGEVVLIAWTVGLLGSLLVTSARRHLPPRTRVRWAESRSLVMAHWSVALGHHGLTLALTSAPLILPVFVASTFAATQVAYFSQARLLADTVLALLYLLTIALFASVATLDSFRRAARMTLVVGTVLALSIIGAGTVLGPVLLSLFGHAYRLNSQPLLVTLLLAGPAVLVKDLLVVLRRLQGRRRHGAITMACWSAAELAGAIIGGLSGGLSALCAGWAVTTTICALIALPIVLKAVRAPSTSSIHDERLDPKGGLTW